MKNAYVRLRSLQKQSFCKPRVLLSKTFGSPKPLVLQNLRLSKTGGFGRNEGVPKQTFGSQNFVQTFGLHEVFGSTGQRSFWM